MDKIQNELILDLTKILNIYFGHSAVSTIKVDTKEDKSFITEIDIFVSNFLKEKLKNHERYNQYNFFSEEDFKDYSFPCAILDPIDGTREMIRGRPECAVSLALMKESNINHPENFAWLYNPFSGFNLDTSIPFVNALDKSEKKILTLVSRTEYAKGLYGQYLNNPIVDISPRGSIAFKLGLLASGACDFIVSLEPKNVWDIAAGTILCHQRGIFFYENGVKISNLYRQKYYGPLIWVSDRLAPIVLETFKNEFKNEIK